MARPHTVFALLGQSNAHGLGGGPPYTAANSGAKEWDGSDWVDLADPLIAGGSASMAPALCNTMLVHNNTREYGIVCGAVGSTGFCDTWSDSENATYTAAIAKITAAGGCDSVVFWGGEQDMVDGRTQGDVETAVAQTIANLRADLGATVPIIFMLPYRTNYSSVAVRAAIIAVVETTANCYLWVDAYTLTRGDTVHIVQADLDRVGAAVAQCWIWHSEGQPVDNHVSGAGYAVPVEPRPWQISETYTMLWQYDLSTLPDEWWTNVATAANIAIYDQRAGAKVPRIIRGFDRATKKGIVHWSGSADIATKARFTVEAGLSVNESDSATAVTAAGADGYWPLDEGAGTSAVDLTGSNNLTITAGAWGAGLEQASALTFNGTTSVAKAAVEVAGAGALTVEILAKCTGAAGDGANQRLIDNGKSIFTHYRDSPDYHIASRNGTTAKNAISGADFDNQWAMHLLSSDATGVSSTFVNGAAVIVAQACGTPEAGSTVLCVGNNNDGTRTFAGLLQSLVVYKSQKNNPVAWNKIRYDQFFDAGFWTVGSGYSVGAADRRRGVIWPWSMHGFRSRR